MSDTDRIDLDPRDLCLAALRERLLENAALIALGLEIEIGWKGNRESSKPSSVLVLEAGTGGDWMETEPEIVAIAQELGAMSPVAAGDGVSHGEGIDQVNAMATVDYGAAEFPIDCTLIVTDAAAGKTKRSRVLRAIDGVFGYAPGAVRQMQLVLPNGLGTLARIHPAEDVRAEDGAEGMKRDEWVARWTWEAQVSLEGVAAVTMNTVLAVQPEYDGRVGEEFEVSGE